MILAWASPFKGLSVAHNLCLYQLQYYDMNKNAQLLLQKLRKFSDMQYIFTEKKLSSPQKLQ